MSHCIMNQQQPYTTTSIEQDDNTALDLKELLGIFARGWYWFVLGLGLSLSVALAYLVLKQPEYSRTASVLIKDDKKGGSIPTGGLESFEGLGLLQSNVQVQNELIVIQSPALVEEVIRRLALNVSYRQTSMLRSRSLYGSDLPLRLRVLDEDTAHVGAFRLTRAEGAKWQIENFSVDGKAVDFEPLMLSLGDTVSTPLGRLYAQPEHRYKAATGSIESVEVQIVPLQDATTALLKDLKVSLADEKASVIDLVYNDVRPERAEDILRCIIERYNELWLEDKNLAAVSTSQFIDERLKVIEYDLGIVDGDISSFKSKHLIPDIASVTQISLDKSKEAEAQLLALNNQLAMARYIKSYLEDGRNSERLLPVNTGIGSTEVERLIGEYNETLMNRNRLKANSSEINPLVADLEASLQSMRVAVSQSVSNVIVSLSTQIKGIEQSENRNLSRIASSPDQSKHLITIERQQKIKEALFLFLLQKREENQLAQAFTAYNTRVIAQPNGSRLPTAPITRNVLLVAMALGLMLPAAFLFTRATLDTTLRGRRDTAGLTLPYLGGVPDLRPKTFREAIGRRLGLVRRRERYEARPIVVNRNSGEIGGEAFRILRNNVEVMLRHEERQVLALSSFQPASGKTFISANLAISLALKGKRVLLLDLDMRRAALSKYVGRTEHGVVSYLSALTNDIAELIVPMPKGEGVDIMPVGIMPPNPAELLEGERLAQLIASLRQMYDYIILDCPPVGLVVDSGIIATVADVTAFVLRVGLLERETLGELEAIYQSQKYGHVAYILNAISQDKSGYGYGYGYGDANDYVKR